MEQIELGPGNRGHDGEVCRISLQIYKSETFFYCLRLGNEAEFCSSGEVPGWVLVPEKSSFHRALHLCESLKSEMVLPTSEIGVETLIEMVTEESEVCNAILLMLFVAATDEKHEGNWTSVYSGAPIPYKKVYSVIFP